MPQTGNQRCALRAVCLGMFLLGMFLLCMSITPAFAGTPDAAISPELVLVKRVQLHFNRLERISDLRLWGQQDYWATPSELLRAGGGDCEDLAAAKYFALRELGVPAERLRLVYARVLDPRRQRIEAHVVLWYRAADGVAWLVLDSLRDPLETAGRRADLLPWLTFNETQVARWSAQGGEQVLGGAELLSSWDTLLARQRTLDAVALVLSIHGL